MFVSTNHGVDHVFRLIIDTVFVVGVGFPQGGDVWGFTFAHILPGEGVEVRRVVVHLRGELVSEAHQFEDLTAVDASLEGALSEHDPEQFVGFVVVFVGGSSAADEAVGGVGGEDDGRVVDCSEVGQLNTFKIAVGGHVERVASEVGLPFG